MNFKKIPMSLLCCTCTFLVATLLARFADLAIYDITDYTKYFFALWFFTFLGLVISENIIAGKNDGDGKDFHSAVLAPFLPLMLYVPYSFTRNYNIFGLFIARNGVDDKLWSILMLYVYLIAVILLTVFLQMRLELNPVNELLERFVGSLAGVAALFLLLLLANIYAAHQTLKRVLYDETDNVKYYVSLCCIFAIVCMAKEVTVKVLGKKLSLQAVTSDFIIAAVLLFFYVGQTLEAANIFGFSAINNYSTAVEIMALYYLAHTLITEFVCIKFVRPTST